MNQHPPYHNRRSIRLKGYDYAQAGLYFITICYNRRTNGRQGNGWGNGWGNPSCWGNPTWLPFGNIQNGIMHLNDAGQMLEKWYYELENKYPDKRCHEMVVMPNHIHFIIENVVANNRDAHVGASLRGRPGPDNKKFGATIGDAMDWYKTMTTNEYIRGVKTLGWPPFNKKFWQRNYYEHIIRNQQSYERISAYIINNPAKWLDDKFHQKG